MIPIYSAGANVTDPDGEPVILSIVGHNVPGSVSVSGGFVRVNLTSSVSTHATITVRATDPNGVYDDAVILLQAAPPGSLDPLFDGDGTGSGIPEGFGIQAVSGTNTGITDIKILPDGKVMAVGYSGSSAVVACFNANGTIDATFGAGGKTVTTVGANSVFRRLALQPDGKIVAVGYGSTPAPVARYLVARYTASGLLDTTFNGNGYVLMDVGPTQDFGRDVAIQQDGKIVVAGYSYTGSNYSQSALRLNASGTLDSTFDGDGKVTVSYAENSLADGVALVAGGKIVLTGHTNISGNSDFCAVRLLGNGTVDGSFGAAGKVITSLSAGHDFCESMAVQPDGKMILAGRLNGPPEDFAFLRLNEDGSPDGNFGTNGKLVFPASPSFDSCWDLALQLDGKIVAVGIIAGSYEDMAVVRLLANGSPDNSFDGDGILYLAPGILDDGLYSVEVEADGDIIAGGYSEDSGGVKRMAVVKLNGFGAEPDIVVEHPEGTGLTDGGAPIDFGDIPLGQSLSKTFTIRNVGFNPLYVSPTIEVSVPGSFIDNGISFTSLAPGASGQYTFTFRPQVTGAHSATLRFWGNDPNESPFDITLTCLSTAPEIAVFEGAVELTDGQVLAVNLGSTVIGTPVTRTFSVRNQGNAPMSVTAITLPAGLEIQAGSPALPAVIPAGAAVNVPVLFGNLIGSIQGSVQIASNDADEPIFDFPVSATVIGIPEISVEYQAGVPLISGASGIGFDDQATGATGAPKVFKVKNLGNGPLGSLSAALAGDSPGNFTLDDSALPDTIAPGGEGSVSVRFAPVAGASGNRSAALAISSDDGNENPFLVGMIGLALSTTADHDGDGLKDWAEYQYTALGFHWQVSQPSLVNTLFTGAGNVGLFTNSQVHALHVGTPLLERNPLTGEFTLTLGLKKSTDLMTFDPFPMTAPQTMINGQGKLEFRFAAPEPAAFFRVEAGAP